MLHKNCVSGTVSRDLILKMFKNINLDLVRSGRTCPANLDVQSCLARKLICPVQLSPTVLVIQIMWNSPTSAYTGQNPCKWKPRKWKPCYAGTRCMTHLFLPVIFHFMFQGCTKTIPTLLGSGKITTTSTSIVVFAITTQLAEVVPTSYKKIE